MVTFKEILRETKYLKSMSSKLLQGRGNKNLIDFGKGTLQTARQRL